MQPALFQDRPGRGPAGDATLSGRVSSPGAAPRVDGGLPAPLLPAPDRLSEWERESARFAGLLVWDGRPGVRRYRWVRKAGGF